MTNPIGKKMSTILPPQIEDAEARHGWYTNGLTDEAREKNKVETTYRRVEVDGKNVFEEHRVSAHGTRHKVEIVDEEKRVREIYSDSDGDGVVDAYTKKHVDESTGQTVVELLMDLHQKDGVVDMASISINSDNIYNIGTTKESVSYRDYDGDRQFETQERGEYDPINKVYRTVVERREIDENLEARPSIRGIEWQSDDD